MNITHKLQMDVNQEGETIWRRLWYHNGLWWKDKNLAYTKYINPRYLVFTKKTNFQAAALREKKNNQNLKRDLVKLTNKFEILQEDFWFIERRLEDHEYGSNH